MKRNLLAIDLGKGSIGLALSRSGLFVTPLKEVRFRAGEYDFALKAIKDLLEIERIETFVVGYPLFPSGDPCEMTPIVEKFIENLAKTYPNIEIVKMDERNSTKEASAIMSSNGVNAKRQKRNIDSMAALVILERYLKLIHQLD